MTENSDSDSGFLKRWSRRKSGSGLSTEVEPREVSVQKTLALDDDIAAAPELASVPVNEDLPDQSEIGREQLLTDDDMPAVDTLEGESDYSPFLSEGVSKELRNMALKKLFFSGKFAIRDGLDDYDDDFTRFEPLGNTVTSDMKFHQRRKERERLARQEEEESVQRTPAEEAAQVDSEEAVAEQMDVEMQSEGAGLDGAGNEAPSDEQEHKEPESESDAETPLQMTDARPSGLDSVIASDPRGELRRVGPAQPDDDGQNT